MPTFGNTQVGSEFVHSLSTNFIASRFVAPEDGFGEKIAVYVKHIYGLDSRMRAAIYAEIPYVIGSVTRKFAAYVMTTEEQPIQRGFEGWVILNFLAKPPLWKATKYFLGGWADEKATIMIATAPYDQAISCDLEGDHMITSPKGLGYPRFFEICPKSYRAKYIASIHCVYALTAPTIFPCPYCSVPFPSYDAVLNHIKNTPTEMIHLNICQKDGQSFFLKEELQQHKYDKHGIGSPPQEYSCIFCCSFKRPTATEVYTHINDVHAT